MELLELLSWVAVICLPIGYWKQVYHIHIHKEVRDLSLSSYIFFAVAYILLGVEAYAINSTVFLVKNLLVIVPTGVLIYQIIVHRKDKWVDDDYTKMAEKSSDPQHKQMHKRINAKSKAL